MESLKSKIGAKIESLKLSKYQNEMVELGIPPELAYQVAEAGKGKSAETWNQLMTTIRAKTPEERFEIATKIAGLSKPTVIAEPKELIPETIVTIEEEKTVPKKPIRSRSKYPEIEGESYRILKKMRKVKCLTDEKELKEMTDELDEKIVCKGNVVYVCHHCKKLMCSQHSYWIPDKEFPYIVRKTTEEEIKTDEEKLRKAQQYMIIGIITLIIIVGVYFIWKSIQLKKEAEYYAGSFFPSYFESYNTKWGKKLKVVYENQGYYLAVHCWDCLRLNHSEIYNVALKILNLASSKAADYQILKGEKMVTINDDLKQRIAVYSADLYLLEFKYGLNCYLKLKENLRELERPDYSVSGQAGSSSFYKVVKAPGSYWFKPTPIWLFKPTAKITENVKTLTIEKWFEKNEIWIKNRFKVR